MSMCASSATKSAPVLILAVIGVIVCTFVVGLALVADRPGRGPRLRDPRRDHRDHRSGRGSRDLSRYRGAAPAVDLGSGRKPVQRRRGDRDLLARRCDAGRRPAGQPARRARHLCPRVRRRAGRRLCRRLGGHPVHPDIAGEPTGRGDADDRLRLCDLCRLRSLSRCFRVVAVAAAALAVSAGGRRRLAPSNWESLVVTWEQLAFWASSLIFLFAAMQTPRASRKGELGRSWPACRAGRRRPRRTRPDALRAHPDAQLCRDRQADRPRSQARHAVGRDARGGFARLGARRRRKHRSSRPRFVSSSGSSLPALCCSRLLVTAPTMRPLMRLLKISSLAPAEVAVSQRVIGLIAFLDPAGNRDSRAAASDLARDRRRGRKGL